MNNETSDFWYSVKKNVDHLSDGINLLGPFLESPRNFSGL